MKKVCYTAIFGNYDKHREATIVSEGWDYVLITDNKNIKSNNYEVKYIDLKQTPARNARYCKLNYWKVLPGYDRYLWHDSSMQVNTDLNEFCDIVGANEKDLILFKHPGRKCIYHEAEVIIREKIDKAENVEPQMEKYRSMGFPENYGLHATGLMIRNDSQKLRDFMFAWWNEICGGSRRDQLSFDYVRWMYNTIDIRHIKTYWELLERQNGKFRFKPHEK